MRPRPNPPSRSQTGTVSTSSYGIYLFYQREIHIRNATPVVSGRTQFGVSPTERNVGMMVGGLGDLTDLIHKIEALGEICELKSL
jgi:hypothetical protein